MRGTWQGGGKRGRRGKGLIRRGGRPGSDDHRNGWRLFFKSRPCVTGAILITQATKETAAVGGTRRAAWGKEGLTRLILYFTGTGTKLKEKSIAALKGWSRSF